MSSPRSAFSRRASRTAWTGQCRLSGGARIVVVWSGRRDSNPRPTAWKAVTLPLSYSRSDRALRSLRPKPSAQRAANGPGKRIGGGGWIRTTVGLRRQIYSLLPLSTRPHLRDSFLALETVSSSGAPHAIHRSWIQRTAREAPLTDRERWSRHPDSNRGPTDYKSVALPAELCRPSSGRRSRRSADSNDSPPFRASSPATPRDSRRRNAGATPRRAWPTRRSPR